MAQLQVRFQLASMLHNWHELIFLGGSDFIAISLSITFGAGETEFIVPVSTIDDNIIEQQESFGATLLNPTNGLVVGSEGTAVINIIDNDATTSQCTISNPLMVSTFNVAVSYNFRGICEVVALTSCNGTEPGFAVRVDFLTSRQNGAVGIFMGELRWISLEDGSFSSNAVAAPSSDPNVLEYPASDVTVTLNEAQSTTTIEVGGSIEVTVVHNYGGLQSTNNVLLADLLLHQLL